MGIIFVVLVVAAGAVGLGAKDGMFKNGYDTTRKDTYAFEKHALELHLARTELKQRTVVLLDGTGSDARQMTARLKSHENKLKIKIAELERIEETKNWND